MVLGGNLSPAFEDQKILQTWTHSDFGDTARNIRKGVTSSHFQRWYHRISTKKLQIAYG